MFYTFSFPISLFVIQVHVKSLAMLSALVAFCLCAGFVPLMNFYDLLEGELLYLKFLPPLVGSMVVPIIWVFHNEQMKEKVKEAGLC